ncbi:MAG: DUF488 family protein [Solirubrobacterales bacterium]
MPRPDIYTIGHSTHEAGALVALLNAHRIEAVADVRRYPGSRRNPQFNVEALSATLRSEGIALEQFGERLGGRRRPRADSPNGAWRVEGFRGYADHMEGEAFSTGLRDLEQLAASKRAVVMCAEADWHRCHRRLIADALTVRGWRVLHVLGGGDVEAHEMTSFAVVVGERLTYPPPQQSLH